MKDLVMLFIPPLVAMLTAITISNESIASFTFISIAVVLMAVSVIIYFETRIEVIEDDLTRQEVDDTETVELVIK